MGKILFHEEQQMRQWWLWLLLLVPIGVSISLVMNLDLHANPELSETSSSSSGTFQFLFFLPIVGILLLLYFMKMTTTIDADKIIIKHLFVINKEFLWKDISSAEIITYGFVGYGQRYSSKHGTVYNMSGNKGLAIVLKNDKKVLLGTQNPEELAKVAALIQQIKE